MTEALALHWSKDGTDLVGYGNGLIKFKVIRRKHKWYLERWLQKEFRGPSEFLSEQLVSCQAYGKQIANSIWENENDTH